MSDQPHGVRVDDLETMKDEFGQAVPNPKGIVDRWKTELELADTAERSWRKEATAIWRKYKAEAAKAADQDSAESTFNILWSNTEILVPALYNSTPMPDVRRRYKQGEDALGKVGAQVLERSLSYTLDSYDFDSEVELAALDLTVVGRGLDRIRYLPETESIEIPEDEREELAEGEEAVTHYDRIVSQDTLCEHVQWDDFRHGPGKTWSQVPWVAFRHRMTYDDLFAHFGDEMAKKVPLDQSTDEEDNNEVKALFSTGEVWEIWDKLKRRVLFISVRVQEPLRIDDDPTLQFQNFYPTPRPMTATLDSTSLLPIPLYRQYKSQAQEMDRITRRIEKITNALRVRGLYVSNLAEAKALLDAGDNEMVPIEDAGAVAQTGIDKLIWIMPVDKLIAVLTGLYTARDQVKQTIYEIIGLSDIMRGATQASETLGAQELKSRWGSVRLQRLQKEVQRYVRDLIRLKGEVIAEHYEPDVLAAMTQVKLPSAEEKEALAAQVQQVQQTAQAAEQSPEIPPEIQEMLDSPTWDDVIGVLRSDTARQYKIDIETDSTIASMVEADMQGSREVVEALGAVFGSIPMLQQAGAENAPEVARQIALALIRRGRFGGRVLEDAIEDLEFTGANQMQQIGEQLQQMGAAVQQGTEQVGQMGEQITKHEEVIGQIVQALNAQPKPPPQQ